VKNRFSESSLSHQLALIAAVGCLFISLALVALAVTSARHMQENQQAGFGNALARQIAHRISASLETGDLLNIAASLHSFVNSSAATEVTFFDIEGRALGQAGEPGGAQQTHYRAPVLVANDTAGEVVISINTEVAETGGAGGAEEEVYDLGALLAAADPTSGERAFKAKCSTCHTITDGGSNGTGPNLHAIIGASHAHAPSFGYSSAMQATSGETWTYENIDHWLENPSSYIRGTSMAFAGLRRDDERADVIAYLASNTPGAAAFPEPLPEEAEGDDAVETSLDAETVEDAPTEATGVIETQDVVTDRDSAAEGNVSEVELAPDAALSEENDAGSDTD
jgi:cytochrome c